MFFKTIAVTAFVGASTTLPLTAAAAGIRQGSHHEHAQQLAKDVPQYVRRQLFLNTNNNDKKVDWGDNNGLWTGDFDGDGDTDFGICPIVEGAINLGNEFGIEGNCECNADNIFNGGDVTIDCNFPKVCYPDIDLDETTDKDGTSNGWMINVSEVCGSVSVKFKVDLDGMDDDTGGSDGSDKGDGVGDDNGIIVEEGEDVPVAILSDLFANIGNDGGYVSSTVCVDMENDELLETCFTYQIPLTFEGITDLDDHTCAATYGGQDCICRIDEPFCLYLDCTIPTNDPDAKLDTCQPLQMTSATDATTLLPKFPSFMNSGKNKGGEDDGEIPGGDDEGADGNNDNNSNNNLIAIDWDTIDWEAFDWQNFDWTNIDWDSTGWENFLKDLPQFDAGESSIDVCSFVESVIGISQEFGIAGNCTCDGSIDTGLKVQCEFENECVTPPPKTPVSPSASVSTTRNGFVGGSAIAASTEDVCGSVSMDFNVKNYQMVSVRVCIDFEQDKYDEYCFTYDIPMAVATDGDDSNTEWTPSCVATYGANTCKCEVDHLVCVQVDCSDYLEDAKSDTCQDVRWTIDDFDSDVMKQFLPNWEVFLDRALPETVENQDASGTGADTNADESITNESELPVNSVVEGEASDGAAASTKTVITVSMGFVAALASLAIL